MSMYFTITFTKSKEASFVYADDKNKNVLLCCF